MSSGDTVPTVPPPEPPAEPDAWYAPDVRAQREVFPGVVVTLRESGAEFVYEIREPARDERDERALERVESHFEGVSWRRPRTREDAAERAESGLAPKYRRAVDRLLDISPTRRRRIDYYVLRDLRLLGAVTPLALDEAVEVVDAGRGEAANLHVHTTDYAPATTRFATDVDHADRVAGERLRRYTVPFAGFDVEVVVYREHLIGDDHFDTKYAVLEPDLLPGDERLVTECKERIWAHKQTVTS